MDGYGQCLLCRWFSCRWRRGACSHFSNHGGWSITEASLGWNYRSLINLHPHPEKTSPIPWITLCNILYQYLGSNHGCHLSVGLQGSSSDESRTNTKHQRGLFHKINTPELEWLPQSNGKVTTSLETWKPQRFRGPPPWRGWSPDLRRLGARADTLCSLLWMCLPTSASPKNVWCPGSPSSYLDGPLKVQNFLARPSILWQDLRSVLPHVHMASLPILVAPWWSPSRIAWGFALHRTPGTSARQILIGFGHDGCGHHLATDHSGYLVGGIPTPLKNMSSSVGMMTFPIYGRRLIMFQPPISFKWLN